MELFLVEPTNALYQIKDKDFSDELNSIREDRKDFYVIKTEFQSMESKHFDKSFRTHSG